MKKKNVLLLIIIFNNCLLHSQVFNNRYIIDQTSVIFQRIVQTGDTIITMGMGSTFYTPFPGKLMFTKFNQQGDVLSYDLVIADSLMKYFPLASSKQENQILVVGGAGESITNESGFFALYDLNDGIQWIKQYTPLPGWTFFFENCLWVGDKLFLLANQQNHNNGSVISTKLICINLQGDILWEKDFGDNNFNMKPEAIILNQNSNIHIGLLKSDIPFIQGVSSTRSFIYELNLEGDIVSEWLNDEDNTYQPEQIIEVENSILFVGRFLTGFNDNDYPLWQGYIAKVDSLETRDWSIKTGKPTTPTDLNNLIATMDGNYIAIGVTFDSLSSSNDLTESGHIIKFNNNGEIIWEKRHFGIDTDAEYNKLYDIVELPDSSLLLCGQSVDVLADFPQRGWLLKLDKNGNLEAPVSNTIPYFSDPQKQLLVFPNPAKDQIEIQLNDHSTIHQVEIYDTSGNLVFKKNEFESINQKFVLHISHLPSGIYFIKVNEQFLKKITIL